MWTTDVIRLHQVGCIALASGGLVLLAWLALRWRRGVRDSGTRALAIVALGLVPAISLVFTGGSVVSRAKERSACVSCHLMAPYGDDMLDPDSRSLASLHYRNSRLSGRGCYDCHHEYGVFGDVHARLDGARHLWRFVTHTYETPLKAGASAPGRACLQCHLGTPVFTAVAAHGSLARASREPDSATACFTCHGRPHPAAANGAGGGS